jgi:hypothetical protein
VNGASRRFPRTLAVTGWLVTAALAAGITLAAVSLLGAGIFGGSTRTMSQDEVAQALAATTESPDPRIADTPAPTVTSAQPTTGSSGPAALSEPTVVSSAGGTVIARCAGSTVEVLSWTPAQGFRAEEVESGPAREARVEFESDDGDVRVELRCVDGVPSAEIDGGDEDEG